MFTGDRSGDFLFRALHAAGFASQPTSLSRSDALELIDTAITAACHCAPPDNKPTPHELANCARWLDQTVDLLLPELHIIVCLGSVAFAAVLRLYRRRGWLTRLSPYRFAHGARYEFPAIPQVPAIICSYHPSQQNTFTGKLTDKMLADVFRTARRLIASG
jgi:uracil-DNA glycosylase family 4